MMFDYWCMFQDVKDENDGIRRKYPIQMIRFVDVLMHGKVLPYYGRDVRTRRLLYTIII